MYHAGQPIQDVVAGAAHKPTMLTGWFALNQQHPGDEDLRGTLYIDMPKKYVWTRGTRGQPAQWKPRRSGQCVGRMYSAHPGELQPQHWVPATLTNRCHRQNSWCGWRCKHTVHETLAHGA